MTRVSWGWGWGPFGIECDGGGKGCVHNINNQWATVGGSCLSARAGVCQAPWGQDMGKGAGAGPGAGALRGWWRWGVASTS